MWLVSHLVCLFIQSFSHRMISLFTSLSFLLKKLLNFRHAVVDYLLSPLQRATVSVWTSSQTRLRWVPEGERGRGCTSVKPLGAIQRARFTGSWKDILWWTPPGGMWPTWTTLQDSTAWPATWPSSWVRVKHCNVWWRTQPWPPTSTPTPAAIKIIVSTWDEWYQ